MFRAAVRTRAAAPLAAATAALLGLGACTADTTTAAPSTGPGPTSAGPTSAGPTNDAPVSTLTAAAPDRAGSPYRFTLTDPRMTMTGVDDAAKKARLMEGSFAMPHPTLGTVKMKMSFLRRDADVYSAVQVENAPSPVPAGWYRLDPAKLRGDGKAFLDKVRAPGDPARAGALLGSARDVTAAGDTYRGTLDLTATPAAADALDPAQVKALADKAKAVPFTATLDAQRRLTSLTLSLPAAGRFKAEEQTARYTYGPAALPDVTKAAPAPAALYQMLNG
ncbi:MAG TPA: hypothetical protein VFY17_03630 [Pilimelia sp.]|nr:hypothetical protein [Pilimelia sp.]